MSGEARPDQPLSISATRRLQCAAGARRDPQVPQAERRADLRRGHRYQHPQSARAHRLHLGRLRLARSIRARCEGWTVGSLSGRCPAFLEPKLMWKIQKQKTTGTHFVTVPLVAAISLILIIVGLVILLWSAERGREARLAVKIGRASCRERV